MFLGNPTDVVRNCLNLLVPPFKKVAETDDAAEPVKMSAKKRLSLASAARGSDSGERDEEDSESDSDSDDDDDDSDDEEGEEILARRHANAEERADQKALRDDPPYDPEKNVKRGSAHRNKRRAAPLVAPEDLDEASDSQNEAGATGKSRGKRRATGTPSKSGRPNKRVTRKEKLARSAAALQGSVSSTASTASTQQYQHHPSLADLHAVLPAVQVS